jgi:hypothetical protein
LRVDGLDDPGVLAIRQHAPQHLAGEAGAPIIAGQGEGIHHAAKLDRVLTRLAHFVLAKVVAAAGGVQEINREAGRAAQGVGNDGQITVAIGVGREGGG